MCACACRSHKTHGNYIIMRWIRNATKWRCSFNTRVLIGKTYDNVRRSPIRWYFHKPPLSHGRRVWYYYNVYTVIQIPYDESPRRRRAGDQTFNIPRWMYVSMWHFSFRNHNLMCFDRVTTYTIQYITRLITFRFIPRSWFLELFQVFEMYYTNEWWYKCTERNYYIWIIPFIYIYLTTYACSVLNDSIMPNVVVLFTQKT